MREELQSTLQELHDQLAQIDDLDQSEIELLRQSASEIQATLDQSDVDSASLGKMLQDATDRFSESHPMLAKTAGQVADMLAQMGI